VIGFDYAASQLAGVWRMAWNRDGWRDLLDRSVDGVFRSFWAAMFAAPFSLLGFFLLRRAADRMPDLPEMPLLQAPLLFGLGVEIIEYLANWGAALAVLILFTRSLGAGARISEVIIGFNWLHVFTAAIQSAPLAALELTGSRQLAGTLANASSVLIFALVWGVIRRSMGAPVAQSIGILVFLLLLGLLVSLLIEEAAGFVLQIAA
jgi:hypothetical protein